MDLRKVLLLQSTSRVFCLGRVVSFHQYALALLIFLVQFACIFLLFTNNTTLPPPSLSKTPPPTAAHSPPPQCEYGKVYVYEDLPQIFNKKFLETSCRIDHKKTQCAALSNGGFGLEANATLLANIVPPELAHAWYWTHMFAGDVIFHNRMLYYECRTMEPESAAAFYVPFYAGLAASSVLFSGYNAKERDAPFNTFLEWIKNKYYWKRSNGSDHFLTAGRTSWDLRRSSDDKPWGTRFLLMPLMRNMYVFTLERSMRNPMEVSVPYPTGFHPKSTSEIEQWEEFVRGRKRSNLFTFVGGMRGSIKHDFRGLLLDQCYNESGSCKPVDCAKTPCLDGSTTILEAFLDSTFCLQPRGDSLTRRSVFDCMLAGSIPVFFWKETIRGQYELFMSNELESFSVFIDRNDVRKGTSIMKVLEGYSIEDIKRMRDNVIDMIPRISYGFRGEGGHVNSKDAFDMAVEEVLRRMDSNEASFKDSSS